MKPEFSKEMLDDFEKRHGFKPFQPVPRHSGRYPWYDGKSWHQLDEETKRKEVSRLKEKGMSVWTIADRIGTTIEEIEGLLGEH